MNKTIFRAHEAKRLVCTWVPTGDLRAPLACVWTRADSPRTAASVSESGLRLCA